VTNTVSNVQPGTQDASFAPGEGTYNTLGRVHSGPVDTGITPRVGATHTFGCMQPGTQNAGFAPSKGTYEGIYDTLGCMQPGPNDAGLGSGEGTYNTLGCTLPAQVNVLKTLVLFLVKEQTTSLITWNLFRMLECSQMKAAQILVICANLTSKTWACFQAMEMRMPLFAKFINCLGKKLACFLVKTLVMDMQATL